MFGLALGLIALVLPWFLNFDGLSEPGHRMLGVFLMAIVLWVTEAIPLYATAALIIFLQILFISDQALWDLPAGFDTPTSASYFATLAHPVLMLFLGGFFLAEGAARYRLDRNLARIMLRPFGDSPAMIVLGLMVITAAFSMFMSNTATTATFLAVVLPVVATLEPGDRLRVALVMAIPAGRQHRRHRHSRGHSAQCHRHRFAGRGRHLGQFHPLDGPRHPGHDRAPPVWLAAPRPAVPGFNRPRHPQHRGLFRPIDSGLDLLCDRRRHHRPVAV